MAVADELLKIKDASDKLGKNEDAAEDPSQQYRLLAMEERERLRAERAEANRAIEKAVHRRSRFSPYLTAVSKSIFVTAHSSIFLPC
jgi:hypothetical protein